MFEIGRTMFEIGRTMFEIGRIMFEHDRYYQLAESFEFPPPSDHPEDARSSAAHARGLLLHKRSVLPPLTEAVGWGSSLVGDARHRARRRWRPPARAGVVAPPRRPAAGTSNDALALLECVIDAHANLVALAGRRFHPRRHEHRQHRPRIGGPRLRRLRGICQGRPRLPTAFGRYCGVRASVSRSPLFR